MQTKWQIIKDYWPWLSLILGLQLFTALLLWLGDIKVFQALFGTLVITALTLMAIIISLSINKAEKRAQAFKRFLNNPNQTNEDALLSLVKSSETIWIKDLSLKLNSQMHAISKTKNLLSEYEDYVETWIHEIKLSLSLLNMIIDNEREDLDPKLCFQLEYIQNHIQTNLAQILFYYRIQSEKNDFLLEDLDCFETIMTVISEYKPLIDAKNIIVTIKGEHALIHTDRRAFEFMIAQIIDNAIKYSDKNPYLHIKINTDNGTGDAATCTGSATGSGNRTGSRPTTITFKDNGCGVKACDLPDIFNKGFTGDSGNKRKKSTGMGFYLLKHLSEQLKIKVEVQSEWQKGFCLSLIFASNSQTKLS